MRTESLVRAGEKTDSSTSSTSNSSAAPTRSYSSTTRSQMAYITASGPCCSTLARRSRSRRDVVLLVDVPQGLEDQEERVAVGLHLGTLVGVAGVLDGQRVEAERRGDLLE